MDPLTMLAIGAALGLGKSALIDAPKEERDRKLAAATQRYSPWTGLKAGPIQEADPFGSALQYGTTGAMMGSSMQNAEAQQELMNAQKDWLRAGGNPSTMAQMSMTNSTKPASPWSLGIGKF